MRFAVPFLVLVMMSLGSCSCSRKPDPQAAPPAATHTPPAPDTGKQADAPAAPDILTLQQAMALQQGTTLVQRYVGALAMDQLAEADAFWKGGHPPPQPDDAALREAVHLRSLRIENAPGKLVASERSWPLSLEMPVTVTINRTDASAQRWQGWYRLERAPGEQDWHIAGASMQPQLD